MKIKKLFDDIREEMKNEKFLVNVDNVIINLEEKKEFKESLEKYCAIFYSARDYLAHNHINMDEFFWSNNKIIAFYWIKWVLENPKAELFK